MGSVAEAVSKAAHCEVLTVGVSAGHEASIQFTSEGAEVLP
jgi:hypothetical protein